MIERLRKQDRQWPWVRWAVLAVAIFSLALYTALLIALYNSVHLDKDVRLAIYEVFFFAAVWPVFLLSMFTGIWLIVWSASNWHGNVSRMLLLKLLDSQPGQKTPEGAAA